MHSLQLRMSCQWKIRSSKIPLCFFTARNPGTLGGGVETQNNAIFMQSHNEHDQDVFCI